MFLISLIHQIMPTLQMVDEAVVVVDQQLLLVLPYKIEVIMFYPYPNIHKKLLKKRFSEQEMVKWCSSA